MLYFILNRKLLAVFILFVLFKLDLLPVMHVVYRKYWFLLDITVKILKFGTPQTIAIIVLKIEKFDVTLH